MRKRHTVVAVGGALLLASALSSCGPGGRSGSTAAEVAPAQTADASEAVARISVPATPEMARDFSLQTLDGATVALSDLRGEWVLVNFWATWCPPCVEEMGYLERLANERELRVLGVNVNEEREVVEKFVDEHGITFPILMEPDEITKMVYEARALPRTVLVAPDGTVAGRVYGALAPETFDPWLDARGIRKGGS